MFHHDWTPDLIRPFVLDTIRIFGVERCMFASTFPVDKLHAEYGAVWRAFDQISCDFTRGEHQALFYDNAARVYRL